MRAQKSNPRNWYLPIILFATGIGIGYLPSQHLSPSPFQNDDMSRSGGYEFVNPLLSCDISEDNPYRDYKPFRQQLQSTIDKLIAKGAITRGSIYFRDMNHGYWTGVNEDDAFIPASLMKVPLMIAYLKESEGDRSLLQKRLFLPNETDGNTEEIFKPSTPLSLGSSYSIQQLVSAMIEQSDNNAAAALNKAVATNTIDDVYGEFGVPVPVDENTPAATPKTYMRFFRILYNASYLWRGDSKTALEMLAQTNFKDGLVAGMPVDILISHKFGERTVNTLNTSSGQTSVTTKQLHDCGIVYYPRSPYGICIMTEGTDFVQMKKAIAQLSNVAYTAVQNGLLQK
ncbi:serine hydrolase [Candidatus Kaiserbacteria bacterium]|nr:serine hydrolase [Candidatus Kaiserbacteria bacterium]